MRGTVTALSRGGLTLLPIANSLCKGCDKWQQTKAVTRYRTPKRGSFQKIMAIGATKWRARTIADLIIEVWEALDCESVGARELEEIQKALRERFGEGAVESPASIARTVADEGAVLRHPEVFDYDAKWREGKLAESRLPEDLSFANLSLALESFVKLDEQRQRLEGANDENGLKRLRDQVARLRADSKLIAQSKIVDDAGRAQAAEISNWLMVWLQSPELFLDWLDLRQRSPEFVEKFRD